MRVAIGILAICLLLAPAGGQNQDPSQLSYAIESLRSEVRTLQNRVQQLEVRQYEPRPRENLPDFDALRQQLNRLEDRIGQLEARSPVPRPSPPKADPGKK